MANELNNKIKLNRKAKNASSDYAKYEVFPFSLKKTLLSPN